MSLCIYFPAVYNLTMFVRLLCFITIFTLLNTSGVEVGEAYTVENAINTEVTHLQSLTAEFFESDHCEDCHDDGCDDDGDCCQKICTCASITLVPALNSRVKCAGKSYLCTVEWELALNYISPFPDQAYKPPLFS